MKEPALPHAGVAPEIAAMLGQMLELAMILRRRRFRRGALELSLAGSRDRAGPRTGGSPALISPSTTRATRSSKNSCWRPTRPSPATLSENEIGFLRRAHPDPEPFKLDQFAEFARSLGLEIDQPQSRFELQRVLNETIGSPEEYAVHYGLLRSLKQASYTPEPESHYALASQDYCHFTSPIRRYPDLQVHRQLIAWLEGKKPRSNHDELFALGQHCTRTERRAEAAERDLIRIKLLAYLEERIGQTFHAIIVGVEDFGLFCRLCELPVDGLIHVSSLSDDFYYLEPGTHTLVGRRSGRRHRLGDRELVRIAHVDVDRRVLDLILADSLHSRAATRRPSRNDRQPAPCRNLDRNAGSRRGPMTRLAEKQADQAASEKPKKSGKNRGKKNKRKSGKKNKRLAAPTPDDSRQLASARA